MNKNVVIAAVILLGAGFIGFRFVTHTSSRVAPAETVNSANLHHLTLKIDGMYCVSCPYNVENALKDSAGVVNVTVGFVGKKIINGTVDGRGEVIYDVSKTNPNNLIQAILPYKGAMLTDEKAPSTQLIPLSKTFSF